MGVMITRIQQPRNQITANFNFMKARTLEVHEISQQMSERTLVPIFVFWALLTIITPTLILLSENSKADLVSNGNITEGMKLRRMIYTENNVIRTAPPPAKFEEELASAPAPEPLPTSTRVTPTVSHLHHNHTLISNRTHDGHILSSPKIHVQVKQTNIR
ncbi:uncharacterized protein LOC109802743 [Cajanus cajan]|uniref:uncharacterized protein LOC109802743 n=1 Tax=Cajanus cajan TaxID=3821 RepID=UPI0010FB5D29|nr:uncharacterized protein LOC109802743 [Cajanus cajan]